MTDTLMEIIGIFLAVLIMFIFPIVALASQHDEIAQTTVETAVADFVNTAAEKGKITQSDYDTLIQKISATGNSFDVQIEVQVLDDNPERKSVTKNKTVKGENLYYSVYTENITGKILEKIQNDKSAEYNLKKDDYIVVTVKNTNRTMGTEFKNFFYSIVGKDVSTIGASSAALVTSSGKNTAGTIKGGYVDPKEEEDEWRDMVTVTYVTNPLTYPTYPEYSTSWCLPWIYKYTNDLKGELTADLTQKVFRVGKGEMHTITNEKSEIKSTDSSGKIKFTKWIIPNKNENLQAGNQIRVDEDTTIFVYYIFETPGGTSIWHKPILYFYPTEETNINVKVRYEDRLTVSYPKYNSEGWNIFAKPDGTLKDLSTNRELYCLYYEAQNDIDLDIYKDGFIVKGEDSAKFLEEKLAILGLNERETEEFIIYWLPKLESNKYNYIRFAEEDYINNNMPIDISPVPDTFIRVLMEFKGLDKPIEVKEQTLKQAEREGYTVVEWGGTEIKD